MQTYRLRLLAFLLVLCGFPAGAQETVHTVILAEPVASIPLRSNSEIRLRFPLATLPAGARVQECSLQLLLAERATGKIVVRLLDPANRSLMDYHQVTDRNSTEAPLSFEVDTSLLGARAAVLELVLRADSLGDPKTAVFEGSGNGAPGRQPRLQVTYATSERSRVDWGGTRANAGHSSLMPVPVTGGQVLTWQVAKVSWEVGEVQTQPVIFDDTVYIVGKDGGGRISLFGCAPAGGCRTVISGLDAVHPLVGPAVDAGGRLYYPLRQGVDVIELRSGRHTRPEALRFSFDESDRSLTLGNDGSLYLSMSGKVEAFMPYPDHRRFWLHVLPGEKSAVTLNAPGTTAYVFSYAKDSFLALDAGRGVTIAAQYRNLPAPPQNQGPTLPVATSDGRVFLPDAVLTPQNIYGYDDQLQGAGNTVGGGTLSPLAATTGSGPYLTRNGSLLTWPEQSVATSFLPQAGARSLAVDAGGNVYALSGNALYYYEQRSRSVSRSPALPRPADGPLVPAPDGTAYVRMGSELWRFRPATFSGGCMLPTDDDVNYRRNVVWAEELCIWYGRVLQHENLLYGRTRLDVQSATIKPGARIVLRTGGSISFGSGFTVEQGASLSCEVGQ